MKVTILPDHFKFFQRHGTIEFSDFINHPQIEQLNSAIDATIDQRSKVRNDEDNYWIFGRDLWRDNEKIKKVICQQSFAQIAAQLTNAKTIRLAFDQVIQRPDLILPSGNLEEIGHLQGIVCALLINLKGDGVPPLPEKPGNAIFVSPKNFLDFTGEGFPPSPENPENPDFVSPRKNIDFSQIPKGSRYLMIAYAQEKAIYNVKSLDMQRLEYRVGELLKDKLHPILYRA